MAASFIPDDWIHEWKSRFLRLSRLLISEGQRVLRNLFDVYHCPPSIDCSSSFDTPFPSKYTPSRENHFSGHSRKHSSSPEFDNPDFSGHSRKQSSSPEFDNPDFSGHSRKQSSSPEFDNPDFSGHSRKQSSSPEFDNHFSGHSRKQSSSPEFDNHFSGHSRKQSSSPEFDNHFSGRSREHPSSKEIDITNIFTLLRKTCGLFPPLTGWNALPHDDDLSLSADIVRIKCYRNKICTHESEKGAKLTQEEYSFFKEKTVSSLRRIVQDYSGTDFEAVDAWEKSVHECLSSPITRDDERNVEKLKEWYLKDVEEEEQESSETDDWDGEMKGVFYTRNEKEEKHYGAGLIRDFKDVEKEQQESNEKNGLDGGMKEVSGETIEKEEKHYGAGAIRVLKDFEEEEQESSETDDWDGFSRKLDSLPERHAIKLHFKELSSLRHSFCLSPSASVLSQFLSMAHGCGISCKDEAHRLSEFYIARGRKELDNGHYRLASTHLFNALILSKEATLLRASLENNIGCALLLGNNNYEAKMALNQAIQIMNCATQTVKDNHFIDRAKDILFVLKNNRACVELQNENYEEALSTYKNLYEEAKDELVKEAKLKGKNLPRLPVENEEGLDLSPNSRPDKQPNLVIVAMNYSQACLVSGNGKLENIVDVLQDVIQMCQGSQLLLVVSARLARILTLLGMKKQVKDLVALHDIDCLKIQEIIENDSLKPFSVIYTDDICRLLAYNGERSKAKELLETAVRVCKEMHFKQHPTVMSLEKTKEELFPTLAMEKTCLPMEEGNVSRLKVVTDVFVEKQTASSTESHAVAFISTLCMCDFLLQHEKPGSKAASYLQNQLAKIVSFSNDPEENDMSKSGISLLSDNKSCLISSICSLLETALLQHAHTSVRDICTSLVSYLPRRHNEDLNEVEYWYKDYCGLLSYFVATNHVQISGNNMPLYVIVASGSGLKTPADVGHLPDERALFKTIAISAAESEECSSNTSEANAKCFVFLRSQDLVDMGDLRRINNTIVQSVQSLESSSTNANYQKSLLIEVGPEIDPSNVSGLCLQLNSLKCCFESSGADCYGPVNKPSVQNHYLRKLQETLTFKDELDLDVFTAVFQYTFCTRIDVDVQYKARKKMVCLMKEPPFSVLTLHTKENTIHFTVQDLGDKYFHDGNHGNDITQLIDDTIAECLEKLGISTNDPRDVWTRLSADQTDDIPIFGVEEEEDELERAFKTNARLTAELEYLKSKQEKQTSRLKKLDDILSEMELRVGLLQHFTHVIFSDKDKMEAVENWISRKRTRQADPQEEPSNEARYEVEDILGLMSNDELAELLAEIQRLGPMVTEDEASGGSREVSSNEDIDGAELHLLSDKQRIFLEETIIEKSFDAEKQKDFVEKTESSDKPNWHFPSSESVHDHFSLTITSEESESPVFIEGYTQTDSLSSVKESKDKTVQTDPVQQANVETLENVGMADFRRDRAERQLRKSRLSQDVLAFKNRPRESSASLQGSIVTEASGSLSEGMPPYSFTSESLPDPWHSKASIASQESRHGTEGALSEGTSRDSFTSASLPDPWHSKSSIASQESRHGADNELSKGTPRDSFTSESLSDPWHSKASIASQESRHGTDSELSEGTPLDATSSGPSEQLLPQISITSQESSYGTETSPNSLTCSSLADSSVGSEASYHGTEDATSEDMPPDSIFRDSSTRQYPSECCMVIEASSNSTEEVSNKETSRESATSGSSLEQMPYNQSNAGKEVSHETEDPPIEEALHVPVNNCVVPRQISATSVVDTSENEQSPDDLTSGRSSRGGTNRVVPENEMPDLTMPDNKTSQSIPRESGNTHFEKQEYDDAMSYSQGYLAIAQESGDKESEMNAYMMLGEAHLKKGEYDDAISYSKRCLAIARESGDKEAEMNAYMMLGEAHLKKGEYDDAISYSQRYLAIAQESGDKDSEMKAYMMLAEAHLKKGKYDDAISYSKRCLAIAQESGDKAEEMFAYLMLRNAHWEKGEYDDAISYGERCLAIAQECGDKKAEMIAYMMLGEAHLMKGEYDDVISYNQRCLAIAQECGDKEAEMKAYILLGNAYLNKQEYDDAISYCEKCLSIAQESGDNEPEMKAYILLGNAYLNKQEYDDAISYCEKCLAIAQESGDKEPEMKAYILLGNAYLKKQEYDDAISYCEKCLAIAQESGDNEPEMKAYILLGNAYLNKQEYDDAISCFEKGCAIAQEIGENKPDTNEKGPRLLLTGNAGIGKTLFAQKILHTSRKKSQEEHFDVVDGRHAHQKALYRTCADIVVLPQTDNKGKRASRWLGKHNIDDRVSSSVEAKCKSRRTEFDRGGVDKQRTQKYNRHKECHCVYKGLNGNKSSKGSSVSSKANGRDNDRTRFVEYVESDNCDHTSLNTKKIDFSSDVCSQTPDETSTNDVTSRKPLRDDVRTHERINKHDVHSTTDQSPGTSNVAANYTSCTVFGNLGSSKTTEQDKSVSPRCITGEGTPENRECSLGEHPTFRCNVQSNAKTKPTSKDSESLGENVGTKVGNGQYMSLPPRVLREASNDERVPPLPPYFQQGDQNEACLSTIKETDNAGDAVTVWTSQGARPKRISPLHDDDGDYIVSGVDTSFLARHSRDSSLTQSVYSQTRVSTHHSPFLSLPAIHERAEVPSIARTWPDPHDKCRPPYQGLPLDKRKENVICQDRDIEVPPTGTVTLPGNRSEVPPIGTVTLPGPHSEVPPTGTVTLPGPHSEIPPTGTVTLPGLHSEVPPTGTVPLPGLHSEVPPTGTVTLPGPHSEVPPTGLVTLSGLHSEVPPTGTVTLPGLHSEVPPTGTVTLPGLHSEVPPTGLVTLSGLHSEVPPTGTVTLPGPHSDVATKGSSSPSNGRHPHVEWQQLSTFHFKNENTSNGIVNFSPAQNTDSLSDDEDSYKTADDSFSSLDSLEDQVKRLKMTLSQMSASAMFGPDQDHDDDDDDDDDEDDDDDDEENRSNEGQTENRREAVKNLERTEVRARKTDLEGATSSSPREDISRREKTVGSTGPTSTEQTAQRVSADVIDARERELRHVREREREERRKREEEENKRRLEASQREREQNPPSTPQPARLPVQESTSEWPCSHYKRRCAIKFPCCNEFYYCHRCHNNSDSCPKEDKKALHGTHLRCLVCLTEQEITENSQHCIHCKTQLAEYFCGICKHFTGNEKKPYHCEPCGICRIHSDRSFHCKVCNVCLDERLRNNHICRPDSGHDECCICLEDAFGGCQILPCSHKVHRDCAIAMLQNGVRRCPVCRHPLNQPMQRS